MASRIQLRRGTAAAWTAANPVLATGEVGIETDTLKLKVGNGVSAWAALSYFQQGAPPAVAAPVGAYVPDGLYNSASVQTTNAQGHFAHMLLGAGSIDRIQIVVATAGTAGSLHRLALYRQRANARLGVCDLVVDGGTVDTTTTGVKEVTVAAVLPAADIYHVVVAQQGAPATPAVIFGPASNQAFGGVNFASGGYNNGFVGFRSLDFGAGAAPAAITDATPEFSHRLQAKVRYA